MKDGNGKLIQNTIHMAAVKIRSLDSKLYSYLINENIEGQTSNI